MCVCKSSPELESDDGSGHAIFVLCSFSRAEKKSRSGFANKGAKLNEKKRNHELSSQELKTILQKLEESSFLETDLRSNYVCNPNISEFIFRETFGNNHFLILSSLIKYDILHRKDIQEEDFLTYGKIQIFRGSEDLFSPFQKNSYLTESKKYFLEQILQDIIRDFDPDFIDSVKIHPDVKQKIYKSLLLSIFNGELPEANKLEYIHSKKIEFKEKPKYELFCKNFSSELQK
jgi:hypothetical protein